MSRSRRSRRYSRPRSKRRNLDVLVFVVLALVALGLAGVAFGHVGSSEPRASNIDPARLKTSAPPDPTVVYIIGDSYTSGSPINKGQPTWPEIMDRKWVVKSDGIGRTGYVNSGKKNAPSIPERIGESLAPYRVDLVILAGGANDIYWPLDRVRGAVEDTLATVKKEAPQADVVMLSPFRFRDPNAPDLIGVDDTLRSVARENKIPYINVRTVFNSRPEMIGADNVHPTGEGHAFLARYLEKKLKKLGLPRADATTG